TNLISSGLTDVLGNFPPVPCISYIRNESARDFSSNNHVVYANDSLTTQVAYINMSSTKTKVFKFNYIPKILTADNLTAIEKIFYSVDYEALNFEPDKNVSWSLETNTSSWLQINSTNGTLFGTPHNRDVGQPWVRVIVRDVDGDSANNLFILTIKNTAPTILTANQLTVFEDDHYYVNYNSTDDDGYLNDTGVLIFPPLNLTTWKYQTNAPWLDFDNESGILNGTPLNNHVGKFSVMVFVDDSNGGKNSTSFTLTVLNTPPEIITPDIKTAYKNVTYYNDYNSSDDGQGIMTWDLATNAAWLNLDRTNGTLNGTPRQDDVGSWWVNITVIDDHSGKTYRNFTLDVIDLNQPPNITTKNVEIAFPNRLYKVKYEALDPDTPSINLSWSVLTNATWLSIDPVTGVLSGTPNRWHIGWFWVNVTVRDNEGGFDFSEFRIYVIRLPNSPPEFEQESLIVDNQITIEAFYTWEHTFEAVDDYTPTGQLNWSLSTNADWLSINTSSGTVKGQPEPEDIGTYWVNVSVVDEEGLFNFTNFTLIVKHTNQAPRLSNGGMTPLNGTEEDWFTFYVTYTDADNDTGKVWVWIDNRSNPMVPDPSSYLHFYEGVNYTYRTKLKPGVHTYYFEASDAWDLEARLDTDVPSRDSPAMTNKIKEVVEVPFYYQPMCWIVGIVVIIILILLLQIVLKPYSRKHERFEFVQKLTLPDSINPMVRYKARKEQEERGELGYLCPQCKAIVPDDATKCEACGERFTIIEYLCPHCQAKVSGKDMYCPKCGSKFEELEELELGEELEEQELEEEEPEEEAPEAEEEPELAQEPAEEPEEEFEPEGTKLERKDDRETKEPPEESKQLLEKEAKTTVVKRTVKPVKITTTVRKALPVAKTKDDLEADKSKKTESEDEPQTSLGLEKSEDDEE
ncbi:putative Ig domain-containing protein, partial [[Eubacterium] cellulosolvens]